MPRSLSRPSKDGRETVVELQSSKFCILQGVEIAMLSWAKLRTSQRRLANAVAELDHDLEQAL
jgi:hypothetical protein